MPPAPVSAPQLLLRPLDIPHPVYIDNMVQLDVPRRVHVKGRDQWLAWTRVVNEATRRKMNSPASH